MTQGLSDMLPAIASNREGAVYLLQQAMDRKETKEANMDYKMNARIKLLNKTSKRFLLNKYSQTTTANQPPATILAPAATPVDPAVAPAATPAVAPAAADMAAKAAALAAAKAAATAAKAAAEAAAKAAADAAEKLKTLETGASLQVLFSKYSGNPAPSAHTRSWDPSAKETPSNQKPSINQVGGNVGTDRKATDAAPGVGVDAPSHKATDNGEGGVNAPSNKATDKNSADTQPAGGAPLNDTPANTPANTGSGGNGPSDVRSPTSTEVRSPTSTEVRSPTSTSTEVRSPTSTSTEAYTADNFTATVTGGAGDGANTTVNIYLTPPTTPKINPNIPNVPKEKKAFMNYAVSKYGQSDGAVGTTDKAGITYGPTEQGGGKQMPIPATNTVIQAPKPQKDPRIIQVQTKLKQLNLMGADGKPLVVDGVLGRNTLYAIRSYKNEYNTPKASDQDAIRSILLTKPEDHAGRYPTQNTEPFDQTQDLQNTFKDTLTNTTIATKEILLNKIAQKYQDPMNEEQAALGQLKVEISSMLTKLIRTGKPANFKLQLQRATGGRGDNKYNITVLVAPNSAEAKAGTALQEQLPNLAARVPFLVNKVWSVKVLAQ
jgi:hypothetical protein